MQRRAFLGGAAAAANLSYVNDERQGDDGEEGEEERPGARQFPSRDADMAEVRVPTPGTWEPEIEISGHYSDEWDEHHVEVTVQVGDRRCWFVLKPPQAQQVVEDLARAAEFAERGE